jgi:hypothetical protein
MQIGIRVNADGRKLQRRLESPAVERLDIDELVRKFVVARVDPAVGQGVELVVVTIGPSCGEYFTA